MKFFIFMLYIFFKLFFRNIFLGVFLLIILFWFSNIIFLLNKLIKFKLCNIVIIILLFFFVYKFKYFKILIWYFKLRWFVGLFNRIIFGFWVNDFVKNICWSWLLDNLFISLFFKFISLIFFIDFIIIKLFFLFNEDKIFFK